MNGKEKVNHVLLLFPYPNARARGEPINLKENKFKIDEKGTFL